MKILFVVNTLGRAGAETALLELLDSLQQKEYQISLYVMLGQGELADRLPKNVRLLNKHYTNCSVHTAKGRILLAKTVLVSFFRNGRLLQKAGVFIKNMMEMIKKRQIQTDKLCWSIVAQGAEIPDETYDLAVAYLEGASTYFTSASVKAAKKAAFLHIDYARAGYTRAMDRGCYEAFDRIFAVSDEVRDRFLEMYPEYGDRLYVFHNLVNQKKIRMLAKESGGFPEDFNGYRILTVGRLTREKAYDLALRALYLLKQEGLAVRWYVLGEGDQRSSLEKQRTSLKLKDDFVFCGAVENPYPYYRQCDLYVHATRYEGKSIAIQEAQTLGCAILASDCSGNREQIEDGVDGRFCPLTPEGIAAGIRELLNEKELRIRLGKAAAKRTMYDKQDLAQLLELLSPSVFL